MRTVTVTLEQLHNAMPALRELSECRLPLVKAYWLSYVIQQISTHLQAFEAQRVKLLERYQTNGSVPQEQVKGFLEELSPLLQEPITLTNVPDLAVQDLEQAAGSTMTPMHLMQLSWLIQQPEDGKAQDDQATFAATMAGNG